MYLKKYILVILVLVSFFGFSQSSVLLSDLKKERNGKYIVKKTGEVYSGQAMEKYENGQVGMSGEILNGLFNGLWVWSYENGAKKRETTYNNGVKNGYSYWWYKNGVKKSQIKFVNNKNVEQKRWDKKGNPLPNPRMGRR